MMTLIFATHNHNKLGEVQQLLGNVFELKSLTDMGCTEDIPETAATIEGNALLKSQFVYDRYGLNVFADDTGLEVEALGGAPGVYSARYAGDHHNSEENMDKLLREMKDQLNRNARFRTVIALIIDGEEYLFEGIVEGEIQWVQTGLGGFGYDPIFQPEGIGRSFAEMTSEEKNSISHRGRAIRKLVNFLKGRLEP